MAEAKPKSIPQWQRQEVSQGPPNIQGESNTNTSSKGGNDHRKELLELASQWLEHEDIKDESTDQKITFLQDKGLTKEETHKLLGVSPEVDSSEDTMTKEVGQLNTSTLPSFPPPASKSPPSQRFRPAEPSPGPPIITYPEFLVQSHRPAPLITRSTLLSAAYMSSVAAATVYGSSKYLLNPMLDSLNAARHSLFETTSVGLETLNQKLETIVSTIPSSASKPKHGELELGSDLDDDDDLESDVSDPTELFHRDTGTQTSLPVSYNSSSMSLQYSDPSSTAPLSTQTAGLKTLTTNLSSILSSSTSVVDEDDVTLFGIGSLREYLLEITYGRGSISSRGDAKKQNVDDEISRVRAEIRGVKGVLLSAKSFPGTATGRAKVASS
ncbi:hypothetical protein MMC11_000994 [Xylographa trunciseda]|nr:hypothetical protein [Xylographa trunciseda]